MLAIYASLALRVKLCSRLLLSHLLLAKDPPTHRQHRLEALLPLLRILPVGVDCDVLHRIANLLPAAANGRDLGLLRKLRVGVGEGARRGFVDDGFLDGDDVEEGQVRRRHGDLLRRWVNIGGFVDVRGLRTAHQGGEPFGCVLTACNETFCSQLQNVNIVS